VHLELAHANAGVSKAMKFRPAPDNATSNWKLITDQQINEIYLPLILSTARIKSNTPAYSSS
jgi:hypothetical protein